MVYEDLELMQDACDQLAILKSDNLNGVQDMINREASKVRDRLVSVIAQRKSQLSEDNEGYREFYNAGESPGIGSYDPYSDS